MDGLEATGYAVADGVAWVTLRRPEAANARNQRMREELERIYDEVAGDPGVRVLVLTGAGDRFFCAGMDLKEADEAESPRERGDRLRGSRDIEVLAALPVPTVASVNGFALGGGLEMALACDLRIVANEAQLALPELGLGLIPGGGATQRLPRLIGLEATYDLLYTGRRVDGGEAVRLGMASRCVPRAVLHDATAELARTIAAQPPAALRAAKEAVRAGQELPLSAGIAQELDLLLTLLADRTAPDDRPAR